MSLSLQGSVRTCKVDQAWANKVQSDRFENPNLLLCPIWDGQDMYGRYVNPDSFYTKAPGCASAEDRVFVENDQRPKYFEYVSLDAAGLNNEIKESRLNYHKFESALGNQVSKAAPSGNGHAGGLQPKANIIANRTKIDQLNAAETNNTVRALSSAAWGAAADLRRQNM